MLIVRSEKVATPSTVGRDKSPVSEAPQSLSAIESVTVCRESELVATSTAGLIGCPASTAEGWVLKVTVIDSGPLGSEPPQALTANVVAITFAAARRAVDRPPKRR
jgi:hypothetical protein